MKLSPREILSIGKLTKILCPLCQKKNLLENKLDQTWCANVYCRFGFRELRNFYWGQNDDKNENKD